MELLNATPPDQPQAQAAVEQKNSVQLIKPLTLEEKQRFTQLEALIDAKLEDFFDVGAALTEIRTGALYRETHHDFHAYCQERWGFGRSYADRLIGSAERVRLLPADVPKPANEFQIRPFLKLEPDKFPGKWQEIVHKTAPGRVTSKIVNDALGIAATKRGKRGPSLKSLRYQEAFGAQIRSIRTALENNDVPEALKRLAELERLMGVWTHVTTW